MREMKDSGVEWIGKIPSDWNIYRNKRVMKKIKDIRRLYQGEDVLSLTMNGVIKRDLDNPYGKMPTSFDGYQYIHKGNLLMCLFDIDVTPRCVGLIMSNGVTSPAYSQFKMLNDYYAPYYYYYYLYLDHKKELLHLAKNLRHSFTEEQLGELFVPVPSIQEQRRISDYLDNKCFKIDSVIEKQQAIIDKLKEYKLSILDEMTNGIQGTRCNLGLISSFKNGLNFTDNQEGGMISFLGVGDFKDFFVLDEKKMFSRIFLTNSISQDYMLKNGDIVFVRSNGSKELVGRAIMVNNIDYPLTYSGFCIRFRNNRKDLVDDEYLLFYFRSPKFRKEIEKNSQGSNINNLNQELLSHISFVIPDLQYQREKVVELKRKIKSIDKVIETKIEIIRKVEAYKKSLIYEVVTGKKEVSA